jgi:hypothetical protein
MCIYYVDTLSCSVNVELLLIDEVPVLVGRYSVAAFQILFFITDLREEHIYLSPINTCRKINLCFGEWT